ncbi:MAG: hypothetical protein K0Q79_1446 [Flavipsychrobacter sp.]|nr:hypothetical protein [Flavipsychrobacter sp.]
MKLFFAFIAILVVLFAISCTHKGRVAEVVPDDGNYPAEIAKIITYKCTNSGCHNQASYKNAAELLLDTWWHMLQGSIHGADVVAYSPKFSTLLYYLNTDSATGPVISSKPGHLDTPLTKDEYTTLYNWIAKGAPDKHGNIPFASSPESRQKLYLNVQGCNLIAVIDAKTRLVIRYIPVGSPTDKTPHVIRTSKDGRFAYVPFYNGSLLQKLDMQTDTVIASINIGSFATGGVGNWSSMVLSPLDTALLVSGWINNGCVVAINTANMHRIGHKSIDLLSGITSLFPFPHGVAANKTFDTFYATLQQNIIRYAFNSSGVLSYHKIISAPGAPHEIEMTPDHSKYFVTCPRSAAEPSCRQVRVYDAHNDTLLRSFEVGTEPKEMALAPSRNLLFVTCMEDGANPQVNRRGSVYVFNYSTLSVEAILYGDFFQPHGIAVDEQNGLVFIPSRNADPSGPAPHHSTSCSGRPGWYTVYNLNTLQPADNKRYDVPSDPYSIATRFR